MMDYYSSYPQPNEEVRIRDVMEQLTDEEKQGLSKGKIEEIVTHVVKQSVEFSLTGYAVFGKVQNLIEARKKLNEYKNTLNTQKDNKN